MIYTQDSIDRFRYIRDQLSLLECLPYIEREYVDPTPTSIPLMELADCPGVHFIRYTDLEKLAEVEDVGLQEAAVAIRDANFLTKDQFVVAMEEWRPLLDPSLIDAFPNVVLIKEVNTTVYQACEACMNMFMETHDALYVDLFLEADDASMTQYHLKAERLQSQIAAATEEIKKMRQGDPNYANAQKRLMGMQDALAKTQRMMSELEKRGSKSTADPNAVNGAVADARKAGEARGKEFAARAANGFQSSSPSKTAPLQQSQPTQQQQPEQQGWWARKWAAFRNWMDSLGSNGDQKSTWFTNMTNKVKSFFNGGASTTQATNQQQQPAQHTNQPSSSSGSKNAGVDAAVDVVGQHIMDTGAGYIDKAANKLNNFTQEKLGLDLSPFIQIGADIGKQYMGDKLAQGMDVVKDKGGDMANSALDKAGEMLNQGYQKVKTAVTGGA